MAARHSLVDLEQVGAADLEAPLEVRSLPFSSPVEPQRSALALVWVLSQVCYDHLGLWSRAPPLGLELPWKSSVSRSSSSLHLGLAEDHLGLERTRCSRRVVLDLRRT